jgi:hypothetical protein
MLTLQQGPPSRPCRLGVTDRESRARRCSVPTGRNSTRATFTRSLSESGQLQTSDHVVQLRTLAIDGRPILKPDPSSGSTLRRVPPRAFTHSAAHHTPLDTHRSTAFLLFPPRTSQTEPDNVRGGTPWLLRQPGSGQHAREHREGEEVRNGARAGQATGPSSQLVGKRTRGEQTSPAVFREGAYTHTTQIDHCGKWLLHAPHGGPVRQAVPPPGLLH